MVISRHAENGNLEWSFLDADDVIKVMFGKVSITLSNREARHR